MDPQLQQAFQAMAQLGAGAIRGKGALDALNQQMARLRLEMQRGTGTVQSNAAALQSLMSSYGSLQDSVRQSAAGMDLLKQAQAAAAKVTGDAVGQMAMSLTKGGIAEAISFVTSQLYASIGAYQTGASGIETMFASQNAAIESQIRMFDKLTAGADAVATTFALIPNPIAKGIAAMAVLAGGALGVAKSLTELDKQNIQMLQTEIKNMGLSFGLMEKSGAAVTEGFDGMRGAAGTAQLYQEEFAKTVVRNKQDLLEFGNTVTGGVKRFKAVNVEINKLATEGKLLRKELTLAGISAEEQADGLIQYMELMNRSGQLQKMTDRELATGHAEYLKNMKAASMFTGEDAKQAQARAKRASEQLAVQAKLEEQGAGASERFTSAVAAMGPDMEKALTQMVAGDGTIVDKNLNLLLQASPTRRKILEDTYKDMQDKSLNAQQIQERYQKAIAENGEALKKEALEAGKTFGTMSAFGKGNQELTEMLQRQADLGRQGESAKGKENGEIETTVAHLKKLTAGTDEVRNTMVELDRTVRENLLPRMNQLGVASSIYLAGMDKGKGAVSALKEQQKIDANTLQILTEKVLGKFAAESGGVISRIADNVTTGLAKTVDMLIKAANGLNSVVDKIIKLFKDKLGMATGGIVSGPASGYTKLVEFHGTEAIFPKQALDFLSEMKIPDPKTMLDGSDIKSSAASSDDMNKILDTVASSMTGITSQLTAQSQKTDSKFDEMLQALRDKTIFEDMIRYAEETAENTRRMANELA